MSMLQRIHRNEVFVAGGQPTITYVKREELHVERELARAIATPNHIVSLSGPTKTGKTVLCRKMLSTHNYIWIDGGQVSTAEDFWENVCGELSIPFEVQEASESQNQFEGGISIVTTAKGSKLEKRILSKKHKTNIVSDILQNLVNNNVVLVIDDFHYINSEVRSVLMRNVKGAVFNGLKVLLLSVTHRAFDAIKAESELTGRFTSITMPPWSETDLRQIPILGFSKLGVKYIESFIQLLAHEAQDSPFLMQKFCWEVCFDCNIEVEALPFSSYTIDNDYDCKEMFVRLARDAGLPIYQKLAAGPQSRKVRTKRPMRNGEGADIYTATLLAIAETGPKSSILYEELRESLSSVLADMMPQKHEITSALKHLSDISKKGGLDGAIDWDEDNREINITDPYLRFYLRWQVRQNPTLMS